jgi:hypothetical protein
VNEPEKDCDGAADREPAGARVVVSSAASNVVVAVHVTSTGTPCVVSGAEAEPALHCVSEGAQPHLFPPPQQYAVDVLVTHSIVNQTPGATVALGYVTEVPAEPVE